MTTDITLLALGSYLKERGFEVLFDYVAYYDAGDGLAIDLGKHRRVSVVTVAGKWQAAGWMRGGSNGPRFDAQWVPYPPVVVIDPACPDAVERMEAFIGDVVGGGRGWHTW